MKSQPGTGLVRTLRILFSTARWVMALSLVATPLSMILLPARGITAPWFNIAKITFAPENLPVQIQRNSGESGVIVGHLTGELALVDAKEAGPEFVSLVRWTRCFWLTV